MYTFRYDLSIAGVLLRNSHPRGAGQGHLRQAGGFRREGQTVRGPAAKVASSRQLEEEVGFRFLDNLFWL